jgi:hypothetical protein
MRQRSILQFGCLISSCTIAFASPAIAQSSAPVIRANGFTKQVPSCYIETTNSGIQNLDATCLMGKAPDPKLLDMVTDRDKDGVPDDLAVFFDRMSAINRVSSRGPEGAELQAAQIKKMFQELGQRAPVSPETRRNLNELADASSVLGKMGGFGSRNSPAQQKQLMQQFERFSQLSQQLEKDPFMKKMNEYSRLYERGKAKR